MRRLAIKIWRISDEFIKFAGVCRVVLCVGSLLKMFVYPRYKHLRVK